MARREELLISRSRTLRSRRAFAASSFTWSSLFWPMLGFGGLGGVAISGFGRSRRVMLGLSSGSSPTDVFEGSIRIDALLSGRVIIFLGRGLESIELILKDFAWPIRAVTGVLRLDRLVWSF